MAKSPPKGPKVSSLYRTCATEVTFYRPCAAQIALRRLLEARFEHFWALLPKWLSGGLWRFIFYHFWAPAAQMAFRKVLEVHPGSGSSLYRTCVAEDTFYGPCATQECAWDGASGFEFVSHLCDRSHFLSTLCGPNSSQETSARGVLGAILGAGPRNAQNEPPEAAWERFWEQGPGMLKMSLQGRPGSDRGLRVEFVSHPCG